MIPDTVIRVLELAEQYALAAEVPLELKDALDYCIGKQWVKIQPVYALLDRERSPSAASAGSNFAPYRRSPLVLPGTNQHPRRLLLESEGRATLAERRLQSTGEPLRNVEQASTVPDSWSEPQSPAEWCKELGKISKSTWLRDIRSGKLIVDRTLGVKRVRIRLDSLAKYRGTT